MEKRFAQMAVLAMAVAGVAGTALGSPASVVLTVDPSQAASSTNFQTIQAAVNAVPAGNVTPYTINIAPGTYNEAVLVPAGKDYITLNGTGGDNSQVVMSWHDWDGGPNGWEGSQPLRAYANNFRVNNLTLQNTWGDNGQAMALKTAGDKQIYSNVQILGFQDTLYLGGGRQYFYNSTVKGRVDFLWGPGTGVFDHDTLVSHVTAGNGGYITAANTPASQQYGYLITNSHLTADSTDGSSTTNTTMLGRPWSAGAPSSYAQVAYTNDVMDDHIQPAGWYDWGNALNQQTARYVEYNNTGPGANTSQRVPWARVITDPNQAAAYSISNYLAGWDPLNTPMVPVSWNGGAGDSKWGSAGNWDSGNAPMVGQNLYIQTPSAAVTVDGNAVGDQLTLGKTGQPATLNIVSTGNMNISGGLFLDGGSTVNIDGGTLTVPTITVDVKGTTNVIYLKNNGQLNIGNWTGPWGPAGLLVINNGTFASKGFDGAQINMAPNSGDVATVNIRPGDSWNKTRYISTGDGTSVINQTGGTVNGTYGPYMGSTGTGQGTATYNLSGGTAFWLDPTLGKSVGGTFTVNQTGGTINAVGATGTQQTYNDGIIKIGDVAGANATWNLSGTGALNHRGMWVGNKGTAVFAQTGGAVTLNEPITWSSTFTPKGAGLNIGVGPGTGLYKISGGSLTVQNGALTLGYSVAQSSTGLVLTPAAGSGMLQIIGNAATINITGNYWENANSALIGELDATGLSTIHVSGDVNFANGALLNLLADSGAAHGTYTLMSWTGNVNGTPTLAPSVDTTQWSFAIDPVARTLTATYVPEPASLGLLGVGLLSLCGRRRGRK